MGKNEEKQLENTRHTKKTWVITGMIVTCLLVGIIIVLTQFKTETIQVTGNVHYTEDQIIEKVVGSRSGRNTLLLYQKYKLQPI